MTSNVQHLGEWRRSPWRYVMWAGAGALLVAALAAFEAIRQGEYGLVVIAVLFALVCLVVERGARKSTRWAYWAGVTIAILTGLGQMYMNLAVGLVGNEDNPINLMFFAVVAFAALGSAVALGRPAGLAWAMAAAALAQVAAGAVGVAVQLDEPMRAGGMVLLTLYFVGLWLNAGALFRLSARPFDP